MSLWGGGFFRGSSTGHGLTLKTGPVVEPVSLDTARQHLRIDATEEDESIERLNAAARRYVERVSGRSLITQTWEMTMDGFPWDNIFELPRPPLIAVNSIKYTDSLGNTSTLNASQYVVDATTQPGRVALAPSAAWPAVALRTIGGVVVNFDAGYGVSSLSVPETYIQAILVLLSDGFENRESGFPTESAAKAVASLLGLDQIAGVS